MSLSELFSQRSGKKLTIIAGPCQLESEEHALMIARTMLEICSELSLDYVFKGSFDKANRSSINSQRGLGIEAGIEVLAAVKNTLKIPVITDVHLPDQVKATAKVVDILQIPAFLCRQTDLLLEAGKSGLPVQIKKGQFLHPEDMKFAAEKVRQGGSDKVILCERGSCFGYRDLVVDMRSLLIMRELGCPVVFDATHSVQSLGGSAGTATGRREQIAPLARAAVAVGVDGVFLEVHEEPARAPSDAMSMLPLAEARELLKSLRDIHQLGHSAVN